LKPTRSPVSIIPVGPPIDEDDRIPRQSYSLSTVVYACGLVLRCGSSMAAVPKTFAMLFPEQARQGFIPHATTGRMWLLRLGYYKLRAPLEPADDWLLLVDHAVEIGKHRFLGVVGIRLANLPPSGECLKLTDLTPVALLPVESSTQAVVHLQLEAIRVATGITPAAILSDEGSDLAGGIDRFCEAHSETTRFRDLPHMAARLLKKRLEKNQPWNDFIKQTTQTKFETNQTELAFLVPPRLRSKARYMNLQKMLRWAETVLTVLDDPSLVPPSLCSVERLHTKFGWLLAYRQEIVMWSSWMSLTNRALDLIRRHGYCDSSAKAVEQAFTEMSDTPEQELLKGELLGIVNAESSKASGVSRMPGSTEILESSFGKLKEIEGDQVRSGFTSLILVWAALFGVTTSEVIRRAITEVPVKLVRTWIRTQLGPTVQSKRSQLANAIRRKSTGNSEEH
jgi:hypothetical protein